METSIQVAPITEAEMSTLQSLFSRFADTIVKASTMQTTINTMQEQLEALGRDAEFLRTRNRELDEMVTEVRRQRDEALSNINVRDTRIKELEGSVSYDQVTVETLRRDNDTLNEQVVETRRQRDDLMEQRTRYESKLLTQQEWIDNITRLFNNPPVL